MLDAVLDEMAGEGLPADVIADIQKRRKPDPGEKKPNLGDIRRGQIAAAAGVEEEELAEPALEEEVVVELEPGPAEPAADDEPLELEPGPAEPTGEEQQTDELEIPEPPADWPDDARAQVLDARTKLRRRTDELTTLTEKSAELLERAQRAEAGPPRMIRPTFDDPFPEVNSFEQLRAAAAQTKRAIRWAEDHEDGAEAGVDKGPEGEELTQSWDPKAVRDFKRAHEDLRDEGVPARAAYIREADAYTKEAQGQYPELFKPSPERNQAARILNMVPEIKRTPDFLLWIGAATTGRPIKAGNGNGKTAAPAKAQPNGKPLSKAAETMLAAPQVRVAPVAGGARSVELAEESERGAGSGAAANSKQTARAELLKSQLSDRDLETYIARRLGGEPRGKGGRQRVLT